MTLETLGTVIIAGVAGAISLILNTLVGRWLDRRQARRGVFHTTPRSPELWGSVWYSITLALSIIGMQVLLTVVGGVMLYAWLPELSSLEEMSSWFVAAFYAIEAIYYDIVVLTIIGSCFTFFAGGFLCGRSLSGISFLRVAVISSLVVWFVNILPTLFLSYEASISYLLSILLSIVLAMINFGMMLLGVRLGSRRPIAQ